MVFIDANFLLTFGAADPSNAAGSELGAQQASGIPLQPEEIRVQRQT